jgi:hypothetical protein
MAIDVGLTNGAMSNVIHKKPMSNMSNVAMTKPRLLHESLHVIPQTLRFGATGALGNVLFLLGYNFCLSAWESPRLPASRIYAIFYCMFIPIAHALNSVLVFGWPQHYVASLVRSHGTHRTTRNNSTRAWSSWPLPVFGVMPWPCGSTVLPPMTRPTRRNYNTSLNGWMDGWMGGSWRHGNWFSAVALYSIGCPDCGCKQFGSRVTLILVPKSFLRYGGLR